MDIHVIIISLGAATLSGFATAIFAGIRDNRKEKNRRQEREQDHLKLEVKDLKIDLYKIERELTEWKDKYYSTIQELITVKAELEDTMLKLSFIHSEIDHFEDFEGGLD